VRRNTIFLLTAILIVVSDQLTKLWIKSNLLPGEAYPAIGPLTITHIQNSGAAFGMFTNQTLLLTISAGIGLIVIILFYRRIARYSLLASIALGLVLGGAAGNLIDRLNLGYVTDFIYVRLWGDVYWPAFNIADSGITIGVISLLVFIIWGFKKEDAHTP
jgi:signal peptidase II